MKYIIGCDIGTSGTKTVLYDINGAVMSEHLEEYRLFNPKSGWAEQDPDDWWEAALYGIRNVLINSYAKPEDIKAIGLSGQMHGLVMLDNDNKPLRKAIIWCDQRTKSECEEIESVIGRDRLIRITGNPALTGFTLSKLLWVKNNEPDVYKKCKKILLPKDYIRFKLTEKFVTDVSDASGMQMLDINTRQWSLELLEKFGIPYSLLPEVKESSENSGTISEEAAILTGLSTSTIVAAGAGDQAAAAVGNGIVGKGLVSVTIGSSGVVFAMTDNPVFDIKGRIHTFCHAIKGKWHVMGVTQGAGLSMNWFKENFYSEEEKKNKNIYRDIDETIEEVAAGADGVIYLPYLMGERTPHLDPDARAVFFGMSVNHGRKHLARAVMEGVTYSLKDCLDIIVDCGIKTENIRISGGGAKSPVWRQIVSDVFNTPLSLTANPEAGCLGSAILAAVASGLCSDVQTAAEKMVKTSLTVNPDSILSTVYNKTHEKYKKLYLAVKDLY